MKSNAQKINTENLRTLRDSLNISQDGTYNFYGDAVSFSSGYQVAFQTSESENPDSELFLSDAEYDEAGRYCVETTASQYFIGCFGGDREISVHTESREQALAIAKRFNQHSIWSWEDQDVVLNEHYDASSNRVNFN